MERQYLDSQRNNKIQSSYVVALGGTCRFHQQMEKRYWYDSVWGVDQDEQEAMTTSAIEGITKVTVNMAEKFPTSLDSILDNTRKST